MPSIPLALCLSCCTGPNFAITSTSQVPGSYDGFEHEGFGTKAAEVLSHGPETLPARTACNSNSVRHIFRLWGTLFCPVEFRLKAARRSRQMRSFHMRPRRYLRAPPATATASATSSDCGGPCFVRWSSGSKLRGDLGVVQTPGPGLPYTLVRAAKDSMAVLSRDAGSCSDR